MSFEIKHCNCPSSFQDEEYGKNLRVFTYIQKSTAGKRYRCTVCGKEITETNNQLTTIKKGGFMKTIIIKIWKWFLSLFKNPPPKVVAKTYTITKSSEHEARAHSHSNKPKAFKNNRKKTRGRHIQYVSGKRIVHQH